MQAQTTEIGAETYKARIAKLQEAMKEFGLQAIVLESGPAMLYLTGVRWGAASAHSRWCSRKRATPRGYCRGSRKCGRAS